MTWHVFRDRGSNPADGDFRRYAWCPAKYILVQEAAGNDTAAVIARANSAVASRETELGLSAGTLQIQYTGRTHSSVREALKDYIVSEGMTDVYNLVTDDERYIAYLTSQEGSSALRAAVFLRDDDTLEAPPLPI